MLDENEIEELNCVFIEMDTDKNGILTREELITAFS